MVDITQIEDPQQPVEQAVAAVQKFMWTPTFSDADLLNIFEIYPHIELNSDLGGR